MLHHIHSSSPMLPYELLNDHLTRLSSELQSLDQRLLIEFPPERYVAFLESLPRVANFNDFGDEIPRFCGAVQGRVGEDGLECYHKLLMLNLIVRSNETLSSVGLPPSIRSLYEHNFQRIARNIVLNSDPPRFYLHPTFAKELAICAMRLIPCGVFKVHLHGLPRRIFLATQPTHILKAIRLLVHLGAFKPLFEAHLDSRDPTAMLDFHPEGFRDACRRIAELLQCMPDVRGFFGGSWLHDPQLEWVSPKLAFARQVLLEAGGILLDAGPCGPNGIQDATYRSPERKKLYDEGKYLPRNCLIVVPRTRLIAWASRR